jgi:hypothetical protein
MSGLMSRPSAPEILGQGPEIVAMESTIGADPDRLLKQGRQISHRFQEAIDSFFFDGHPELGKLIRRYGVF